MRCFRKLCLPLFASLVLGVGYLSGNARGDTLMNFSDLTLPNAGGQTQLNTSGATTGYYWEGPDPNGTTQPDGYGPGLTETVGQFTSGGVGFPNVYDNAFRSWSGWAYSNVNDTTTSGYGNQYAAYSASGGGVNGAGSTYAVAYGRRAPMARRRRSLYPSPAKSRRRHHEHHLRLSFHAQWRFLRQEVRRWRLVPVGH